MKRNRKAEASKKQRVLTRRQTETRRIAALLTEMETASSQVLKEQFGFDDEKISAFAELMRQRFSAIQDATPLFKQERRLVVVAQRFGIAAMQILKEVFGFDEEQLNGWLQKVIERGYENREEATADERQSSP